MAICGFVQNKHPPITPDVLSLIAQMDEFKEAWRALGSLAPAHLLALRHVASIESVASSTDTEGRKLSNADGYALLSNIKVKKFITRDFRLQGQPPTKNAIGTCGA